MLTEQAEAQGYEDAEDATVREGWRVENMDALNWALSRKAALDKEAAENAAIVQRHIDLLQCRLEKLNATAKRGSGFFEARIREFAEANRETLLGGGKKKSRTLPHGSVGWRKTGGGLSVVDGEKLLAWCREQPAEAGLLRVKEEPALAAIKAHLKENGEVPDGCEIEPEREELVIKAIGLEG